MQTQYILFIAGTVIQVENDGDVNLVSSNPHQASREIQTSVADSSLADLHNDRRMFLLGSLVVLGSGYRVFRYLKPRFGGAL